MYGPTDLKKGTVIQIDGQPYRVMDYNQKVMGRGGSIVNVKVKNLVAIVANCVINQVTMNGAEKYLHEGDEVSLQFFGDRVINVDVPTSVSLEVTYAENVVKGDTTSSVLKDATTDTGLIVKVPAFIKTGDTIKVDTRDGSYIERQK